MTIGYWEAVLDVAGEEGRTQTEEPGENILAESGRVQGQEGFPGAGADMSETDTRDGGQENEPTPEEGMTACRYSTYEIVSKVAYLIGVPEHIFLKEHEAPRQEVYERLDGIKAARIIRHLCVVRTAIERNFKAINDKMRMEYRSIFSLPEYIPAESLRQLSEDGADFIRKSSTKLCHHIIEINRLISGRISNCRPLFPLWVNWQYIQELFIMPNGLKEEGTKEAAALYYANRGAYPYQMYINWTPRDEGNILYNDRKFMTLLYQWHNDRFLEYSKVSDVSSHTKGSIYDFIEGSGKTVVVVDCENSDPYKLCATLRNLDYRYTQKISRIILFDDVHAASAWDILERFTRIPVEHMLVERIKQDKSLVDIKLTARACREHYTNQVDSFVIVSSDSDYWGLISSLPEARFLLMLERDKCGMDLKKTLVNEGIFYCYIDDFYSGNAEGIKVSALFREMHRYIDSTVRLNVNEMFREALRATRVEMGEAERKQFMDKHIKGMQMSINDRGDVVIEFKK